MPASPQRQSRGVFNRFAGLARKELRETLRDRRTIVTLVLMPLLVYPLLTLLCQKFLLTTAIPDQAPVIVISIDTDEHQAVLWQTLRAADRAEERRKATAGKSPPPAADGKAAAPTGAKSTRRSKPGEAPADPEVRSYVDPDVAQAVTSFEADLGIEIEMREIEMRDIEMRDIKNPGAPALRQQMVLKLYIREDSPAGEMARKYVTDRFERINKNYFDVSLQRAGISPEPPLVLEQSMIENEEGGAGPAVSLAALAPLVLVLMTITGAVYPAIDCTAGERERGTLESLVASPAPRFLILLAKYLAVLTVALLTAGVNLLAMGVTTYAAGLAPVLLGDTFSPLALVAVFGLMILFAAFFSGLLLAVTSFARSFKEAQAYLIPLMLLSLGPGLVSLTPGVELTPLLAATPLLNMVLLARDVLQGTADPALAAFTITATLFYAIASLALAARIFGSDAVLYGSNSSWAHALRRPAASSAAPSLSSAMFCLALLFPAYFLLASLLGQLSDVSISSKLMLAAVVTTVVFGGFPFAATIWSRVRWGSGLRLRPPPFIAALAALVAAPLLGASLWPLAHEVFLGGHYLGIASLDEEKIRQVLSMVDQWGRIPLPLILIAMGLTPALFEELFFRGYLFAAIRQQAGPWKTIVVTSLLFGAFHVITSTLTIERFLPSAALGLVLGYVCHRTGSIWPGVVTHACHNCLLLTITYYQKPLAEADGGAVEGLPHLPLLWIAGGVVGSIVALAIIWATTRPGPQSESSPLPVAE